MEGKKIMQIYVSRNNQQSGPFEEHKVLDMLRVGQLSPNDLGIRQGAGQWLPLCKLIQIPTPSTVDSRIQNIVEWARENLSNQLFVQYKPPMSQLKSYLIALALVGVLPVLVGLILKNLLPPVALILMLVGAISLVVLFFMFALVFLVNNFRKKKFAAEFNAQGVVTNGNVLYQWDKLQYINFLKIKNPGVHGQGVLAALIAQLLVANIRRAVNKDPRQRSLDGAELVFANGKIILPTTMTNFAEIWDFIETVPAQRRFDGRFDQNTAAELQRCGLFSRPQNSAAVLPNPQSPMPQMINQMPVQIDAPTTSKKPGFAWILATVLIGGLVLIVVGGTVGSYFLFYVSGSTRSGSTNSAPVVTNEVQTFSDATPNKNPDFTMTADEFHRDAGDYAKEKQALAKYKNKIVVINGRAYLFREFDGKSLFFRTPSMSLETELLPSEAGKLKNLKESERIKVRCEVVDDIGVKLKNCAVLERKPEILADEKPDFNMTAKEYWEQVVNTKLSYETQQKNRAKYFGKVLEISGKVKKIRGDGYFLAVREGEWVTCYPNDENKPAFADLTEDQETKFKGVDDGISLKHCVISR